MQENTNKTIAINSLILYIRLAIVSVSGLIYTRFSLQALGVSDYGLFSVIACIIGFVSIINTIMVTTSNRFISLAIGRKNEIEACRQFNVNLIIHLAMALLTVVVALPIGHWYIDNHVNYTGDMSVVKIIYDISIFASAISFVGVPYNGLLLAREHFFVFCSTDVMMSLLKLGFTYILIDHFENKLLLYTFFMAFMTAFPTVVFIAYCRMYFRAITKPMFVRDWHKYVEVLDFSIGIGIGAIACIGKAQGGALIVNMFFNTAMNAGLAVATAVSGILQTFANNAQKPISPQIVKNYAVGNFSRCMDLVCLSSKATYLSMFFVSVPFLLVPETILGLWLDKIPPYAIVFTRLLIVDILIFSINAGVNDFVFATGKIKLYQIIVNALLGSSVVVGYLVMGKGMAPECLYNVYIAFSFAVFVVRPFIIKFVRIENFDIMKLVKDSYVPVFSVTGLFMIVFALRTLMSPWMYIFVAYAYLFLITYFFGLKKKEREFITAFVRKRIKKT